MFQPETAERAAMLEGSPDEVADRLVAIFKELGTL
jgi:alkanesulfonate monooxygenase SsuD/methylene tetrahydromethanopterin reductase-like flavin-dependent oxidoreductase (luciferase family)